MEFTKEQIKNFPELFLKIENEVKKEIIGQDDVIRHVLISMVAGGNVLLEGMPGLGKTRLVKALGKTLSIAFSRIQFTPDMMPGDITGTNIIVKKEEQSFFEFHKGPIFANIILADEINRATPKTQSALLEAMQEKTVTMRGVSYPLPAPFFVLATQNPIEMEGTYLLPEAQLDRFMFKLHVRFPDKHSLMEIVESTTGEEKREARSVSDGKTLDEMAGIARGVLISGSVMEYAMDLVVKTHPELGLSNAAKKYIRFGSSPRGAQNLVAAAKVNALLDGRFNVSYDDIKSLAYAVLRHRIILNYEAVNDNVTSDDIIGAIMSESEN